MTSNRYSRSRIIVSFTGGLGNQLFQYAAGRYLSHKNKCGLLLDTSTYNRNILRRFLLDEFSIKGKYTRHNLVSRLVYRIGILFGKYNEYHESIPGKFEEFSGLSNGVVIHGYWQSEKYFSEIESTIRSDLAFKRIEELENLRIASNIRQSNSVSLHIRRGDYISNPLFNRVHGVCSLEYYNSGQKYICSKIESPLIFVFSDDIEWAKYNLKLESEIVFVNSSTHSSINIDSAIADLYLMSLCKHNIIANSSFSWWGAWLNQNPSKIVIAPKKWFNDESIDTSDLIPPNWIRI